jgi:glycosyl transferase family 25
LVARATEIIRREYGMNQLTFPDLMVILINLDRSVQRREQMEERLKELGLGYIRMPAVDGAAEWEKLQQSVDIPTFQRNVGRDVLKGEIGCYHSHLQAWAMFLETGKQTLLVLEDDVVFGSDFLNAISIALENKDKWDILNLNKIRAKQPVRQARLAEYCLNAYIGPLTGMGAYLISSRTVAKLDPALMPITMPIDLALDRIHIHHQRRYGLEPFPSYVDDENQSTITGNSFNKVKKYKWYLRMPTFRRRLGDIFKKLLYLFQTGQIFPTYKL